MCKPTQTPLAYTLLAQRLIADAAEHGTRFGDRKVFLSTIPGIDLADAECRSILADLLRSGAAQFCRADLVGAMDPALVQASEWQLDISTFHFLVLPDHLARW